MIDFCSTFLSAENINVFMLLMSTSGGSGGGIGHGPPPQLKKWIIFYSELMENFYCWAGPIAECKPEILISNSQKKVGDKQKKKVNIL